MCTYYSKVNLTSIPFHTFESIELQKISIYGKNKFTCNLFPFFLKFQKMIKKRFRLFKNLKCLLERELTGRLTYPESSKVLQE